MHFHFCCLHDIIWMQGGNIGLHIFNKPANVAIVNDVLDRLVVLNVVFAEVCVYRKSSGNTIIFLHESLYLF